MKTELVKIIPCQNTLGEGVLWDETGQSIWWTDIEQRLLYRYLPQTDQLDKFPTPERLASFGFTQGGNNLIAAFESGFAIFDPESGQIDWITRPLAGLRGIRMNDGRVDAAGRFWCGTVIENNEGGNAGTLYSLHPDGRLCEHLHGIRIANSICWSPDGKRMYFADSPSQIIHSYDFDAASGCISLPRKFAELDGDMVPDGAITDAEGFLWSAQWGGSRIVRYAPDGGIDHILPLPVSQPTCMAFGGPELEYLFVTSARENLSDLDLEAQPLAGSLFIFKTNVTGLAPACFKAAKGILA